MIYKVVEFFTDIQDGDHAYHTGDIFPRDGVEVSEERIAELASTENKRGIVLIEAVETPQKAEIEPQTDENGEAEEVVDKAESKPKKSNKKEK